MTTNVLQAGYAGQVVLQAALGVMTGAELCRAHLLLQGQRELYQAALAGRPRVQSAPQARAWLPRLPVQAALRACSAPQRLPGQREAAHACARLLFAARPPPRLHKHISCCRPLTCLVNTAVMQ